MSATNLSLKTLYLLSDELSIDFADQLEACVKDCRQKPHDESKRELCVKLIIVPDPEDPDDVLVQPVTTRKTPARKLAAIPGQTNGHNQLQFDFSEETL